jgi:hypothetical protein
LERVLIHKFNGIDSSEVTPKFIATNYSPAKYIHCEKSNAAGAWFVKTAALLVVALSDDILKAKKRPGNPGPSSVVSLLIWQQGQRVPQRQSFWQAWLWALLFPHGLAWTPHALAWTPLRRGPRLRRPSGRQPSWRCAWWLQPLQALWPLQVL